MSIEAKKPVCAYCGAEGSDTNILKQGPMHTFICQSCIDKLSGGEGKAAGLDFASNADTKELRKKVAPKCIKEYLDQYIIGQEDAKKILSTAVYNHMLRLKLKEQGVPGSDNLQKSNVFMIGPSGSGKTALIKRLAEAMEIPFVVEDATTFTKAGYVGRDVESMLKDLLRAADNKQKLAEKGIIYIDEIDKTANGTGLTNRESFSAGVQQALLKMVEGHEVTVENRNPMAMGTDSFKINTENILFIVGGAFDGIGDIIDRRLKKKNSGGNMGFGSTLTKKNDVKHDENISQVVTEDLKDYGIISELLGRIPVMCTLNPLSVEDMKRILTEPKDAITKQYQLLFSANDIDLQFSDKALTKVANMALERHTGARALRGIMEAAMKDLLYSAPGEEYLAEAVLDVDESGEFTVRKRYREKLTLENWF